MQRTETEGTERQAMKFQDGVDPEEAIAYGYLMIALFLLAAAFIWMTVGYTFNLSLTSLINPDIEAGHVSMQTRNAVNWSVDIMRYAPPIILLSAFVFAVNRAIYKRGGA